MHFVLTQTSCYSLCELVTNDLQRIEIADEISDLEYERSITRYDGFLEDDD